MHQPSEQARLWLANYRGSIDATALLLAFDAGKRVGGVLENAQSIETNQPPPWNEPESDDSSTGVQP